MNADRHIWQVWEGALRRWEVKDLVISFLESAGPLSLVIAQFIYIGQPLLASLFPKINPGALASMLEDDRLRQAFMDLLRKE
jgi:hypothetical protein